MSHGAYRRRSRLRLVAFAALTIVLGLASRQFPDRLPSVVALYAGDTLWATLMFWLLALGRPSASTAAIAAAALLISVAVELSQLVHVGWLNAIRANPFGALVLGQGFLWSDLLCYAVGVALAAALDRHTS